jgi:hypothetical protein
VSDLNKIILQFAPKNPASYPCLIILKSPDKTDIRVIEVIMTAIPQMIKAQLEFVVPARGNVAQEIPIVNNSERDWVVKANLTGDKDKNGTFNINLKELHVKRKSTNCFVLSFKPLWVCELEAKLVLNNATTNEIYEYDLKGIGEEPLAEDHIVLTCKAREMTTHNFDIKNTTSEKPQVYRVETDLNNVTGTDNFKVKARETYKYAMSITPILGGVYTGSITFYDNEDRFIWYTVEVRTDSPRPEKCLDLKSYIRKAVGVDISLDNPLSETITFEVYYNGEGLLGDTSFNIEPSRAATYELIYSPLRAGKYTGTIGFLNEKVGEFWYDLNLTAEENPTVNLDLFECELGKVATQFVNLENPTGQEIAVDYKCSNATNFEIIPEKI